MYDWYETVMGRDLEQGDLLMNCPVPQVEAFEMPLPETIPVVVDDRNLIVLTQSCDLVNDKIEEVMLATVREYQTLVAEEGKQNGFLRGREFRRAAAEGKVHYMSLLPPTGGSVSLDWSLVDFHHLFQLPKNYLMEFAARSGERLRLVPPYREHMAQAFARYFMRVGLPSPLGEFEQVKAADTLLP